MNCGSNRNCRLTRCAEAFVSSALGNRNRFTLLGERFMIRKLWIIPIVAILVASASAQDKKDKPPQPTPTAANFKYGTHERQVLDFWQAQSHKPTPLVLYIHGGGWQGGDKSSLGAAAIKTY